MATNYIAPIWRMPENTNKDKLSNYSIYFSGITRVHIGLAQTTDFLPGEPTASGNISNPKFSASIFFNFSSTISGSTRNMFGAGETGGASYWYLRKNASDNLDFYVRTDQGSPYYTTVTGSTVLNADQWYHACVTWDGNNINLYLDGQPDASSVAANNFYFGGGPGTEHPSIGSYWRGGANINTLWTGRLAQASVFNYELSSSQASNLNNGVNPMVFDAPPTFYYPMGDNSNITEQAYGGSNNFFPNISVGADSVFDFDGSNNEKITASNITSLNTGDLSASIWFYATNSGNNIEYLFDNSNALANAGFTISINSANGRAWYIGRATTTHQYVISNAHINFTNNVWNHLCFSYNDTTKDFVLYLNGNSVNSGTATSVTKSPSTNPITIGGQHTSYDFTGKLSNAQIWQAALTDSEVEDLYNNGQPLMTGTQPQEANLKAWYKLNQSANWEADTANNWQIPDAVSAYPQSFDFSGGDKIEAGTAFGDTLGNNYTGDVSFSFWYNADTNSGIFSLGNGSSYGELHAQIVSGKLSWGINNDVWRRITSTSLGLNTWNHIVLIYKNASESGSKIYVNGSEASTTTAGGAFPTSNLDFAGKLLNIGSFWVFNYDGKLSNFQAYNTELSAPQVETLYNNGVPLTTAIATDNIKAWYKLNDNELFGGTNWSVENQKYPANWESALSFNGSSDYVDFGNILNTTIAGSFSISAWMKSSNQNNYAVALSKSNGSNGFSLQMRDVGNDFRFNLNDGSWSAAVFTVPQIDNNEWYHVVGTFDGSTIKIYVNGVPGTSTTSGTPVSTSASFFIGKETGGNIFRGQISNVAVFNTTLDLTAIQALYNNGTPETSISSSPVSWWKLNNTTTGIQDSVGSNDGTNNGTTKVNTFVSTEAAVSSGMTEQNLVNNNVSALNGASVGMNTTNLVTSNLTRKQPYSSYSVIFNGTDYFDFNNASTNIMAGKTDVSISVWFKLNSTSSASSTASNWYGGGTGSTTAKYLIRYNSASGTGVQWYVQMGATYRIDSGYFPSVGDWVHVVGVKDSVTNGGQIRLYINGAESSNSPLNNTNFANAFTSDNFDDQIGVFNNVSSPMNGSISNVAYWTNTALTQDDALNLYNNGITQDLNNFRIKPDHWCPMDGKKTYYNGSVIVARDAIGTLQATGVNLVQENIVGNAPGSSANGTGSNLTIADLKGDMYNSTKNAYSINMADYGDPNSQGVTPANSGRTTSVPG